MRRPRDEVAIDGLLRTAQIAQQSPMLNIGQMQIRHVGQCAPQQERTQQAMQSPDNERRCRRAGAAVNIVAERVGQVRIDIGRGTEREW